MVTMSTDEVEPGTRPRKLRPQHQEQQVPRSSLAKPPTRDSAEGCLLKGSTGSRDWIPLPRTESAPTTVNPRRCEDGARKKGREGAEREGESRRGKRELMGGGGGQRRRKKRRRGRNRRGPKDSEPACGLPPSVWSLVGPQGLGGERTGSIKIRTGPSSGSISDPPGIHHPQNLPKPFRANGISARQASGLPWPPVNVC